MSITGRSVDHTRNGATFCIASSSYPGRMRSGGYCAAEEVY